MINVNVFSVNKYQGWYTAPGRPATVGNTVTAALRRWREQYGKPVMVGSVLLLCTVVLHMQVTEYGADAVSGLHTLPSMMFTEDYQVKLTLYNTVHCCAGGAAVPVLVRVRLPAGRGLAGGGYGELWGTVLYSTAQIGEMPWVLADFMTKQEIRRVVGNR